MEKKDAALTQVAAQLGLSEAAQHVLSHLWDVAFEEGQLAALDELQDRFCVCMK